MLHFDAPAACDNFAGTATGPYLDDLIARFRAETIHERDSG